MSNTRITYVASGGQNQFYFNFCVWDSNDVRVMRNSVPLAAPADYSVALNPMPVNSNFGHEGGSITLAVAPMPGDKISIYRHIGLNRVVAYQPSLPIAASTLNMDLNYCIETLKDFNDRIDDLASGVENFDEIIAAAQAIQSGTAGPDNFDNVADYGASGTSWYRKYNSGWVQQMVIASSATMTGGGPLAMTVPNLPVVMANANYSVLTSIRTCGNGWADLRVRGYPGTDCAF